VRDLTMAYGSFVLMRDLNLVVKRGDIFIIMGGSGCGKSTLLRHLIGLKEPATGEITYGDIKFTQAEPEQRECLLRRFGILLDAESRVQNATGDPHDMIAHSTDPRVRKFLTRGQEGGDAIGTHE
jgi:ABC-type multidrug transport system ATPase subunit